MSASRMAFSSALPRRGIASCDSVSSTCPTCPACSTCPSCFLSATVSLRIANGMGRVCRPRALVDADRSEAAGLEDAHELQSNHLEQRQERDAEAGAVLNVGE